MMTNWTSVRWHVDVMCRIASKQEIDPFLLSDHANIGDQMRPAIAPCIVGSQFAHAREVWPRADDEHAIWPHLAALEATPA